MYTLHELQLNQSHPLILYHEWTTPCVTSEWPPTLPQNKHEVFYLCGKSIYYY